MRVLKGSMAFPGKGFMSGKRPGPEDLEAARQLRARVSEQRQQIIPFTGRRKAAVLEYAGIPERLPFALPESLTWRGKIKYNIIR